MRFLKIFGFLSVILFLFFSSFIWAENVTSGVKEEKGSQIFWLANDQVKYSLIIEQGKIVSDRLEGQSDWLSTYGKESLAVETDADFALDVMWTGWRAPGKVNNADNPVIFSKKDFLLEKQEIRELGGGGRELDIFFKGINNPFLLRMTFELEPGTFYLRRKISICDSQSGSHFLRSLWPRSSLVYGDLQVVKEGGFGQPIAFSQGEVQAFFGLEYPASENSLHAEGEGKVKILCGQEIGQKTGQDWIESESVVEALVPEKNIKRWFFGYLDKIRVAPLRPYALYNSWYDLRAAEMVKDPAQIMNEENVMRIIHLFQKNMVEKYGINLDAFILDDGWDTYKSDWVLREKEFPRGLRPIADELRKMGTNLGLWLGPIGGYSNRSWRVEWMKANGYEVVGDQMCVAGENYRKLLKKRVTDFVVNDGVGYYKWDGVQYSCSEPDHGHPVDIYSRRAVLESVLDLCRQARQKNPDIFLNITSGTWLSPWWLKYTNQIWMGGEDYGYSSVPSITRRDAAITYRDSVLYEDFREKDFWFPIANLMTHGIIKGNLQKLGGEIDPLDKFTDDVLLYFARGISMWELYISPDLLTAGEWKAIADAMSWAKDRFPILSATEMIGGDPKDGSTYGYVHFKGKKGIIVARNPVMEPGRLRVELAPSQGLDSQAASLVVEKIYPLRWVFPYLYAAGANLEIPLQGYETAIFEVYPLEEARVPLLAGVTFEVMKSKESSYSLKFYEAAENARLLNLEKIKAIEYEGKEFSPSDLSISGKTQTEPVTDHSLLFRKGKKKSEIDLKFRLEKSSRESSLALLLQANCDSEGKDEPVINFFLDGKEVKANVESQKGLWAWYTIQVPPGGHLSKIQFIPSKEKENWQGKASLWLIFEQEQEGKEIVFEMKDEAWERPMPPRPLPPGIVSKSIKLGDIKI